MGLAAGALIVRLAVTTAPGAAAAAAKRPQSPTHEQRLLSEASRTDPFQRAPLMLAAVRGDTARVKRLLDRGADVDARDRNGMTALMWASPAAGLLLLRRGASLSVRDHFGRTALHFAAFSGAYSQQSLITALLGRGAAIEARDDQGWTPLQYAVSAPRGGLP
jgi:ankyrin repeat protein